MDASLRNQGSRSQQLEAINYLLRLYRKTNKELQDCPLTQSNRPHLILERLK